MDDFLDLEDVSSLIRKVFSILDKLDGGEYQLISREGC